MEFENGSLQEFRRIAPGGLAGYINQDETAILCGVWEFSGARPNNSVYLPLLSGIFLSKAPKF